MRYWKQIREKGILHWIIAAALIAAGSWLGHFLDHKRVWLSERYKVYQWMHELDPAPPYNRQTLIVEVGDEDFWKGEPDGRNPISRRYLAKIVRRLGDMEAKVIALDFDLRSPDPHGNPVERPSLQAETDELLAAIRDVSKKRTVVLPAALNVAEDGYVAESNIYSGAPDLHIQTGYIILPYDRRKVPVGEVVLAGGKESMVSFSRAIVRAINPRVTFQPAEESVLQFGSFMKPSDFPMYTAGQILDTSSPTAAAEVTQRVSGNIVIVGGTWSRDAYGRGERVDVYDSPAGDVSGCYLHANYVEAMLGRKVKPPFPEHVAEWAEWLVLAVLVIALGLPFHAWQKVAAVFGACLILGLLSYFVLFNLGFYFDAFIPVILLVGHAIFDQVTEWRNEAAEFRRLRSEHSAAPASQKGEEAA